MTNFTAHMWVRVIKMFLLTLFLFFWYSWVNAATISSTQTGWVWSDPATWSWGIVPWAWDDVVINSQVLISNTITFDTLTINDEVLLIRNSTLNGDVIITSSGSLWRVVSTRYLTLTINWDVVNDGQIGWWGTNLDIHFRWDVQNNGTLSWVNRTYLYWDITNWIDASWVWATYISDTVSDGERTIIPSANFKPDLFLEWDVTFLWDINFQFWVQWQNNTLFIDGTQEIYIDSLNGVKVFSSNGTGDGESATFWTVRNAETNIENVDITNFMFIFTGRNISAQWAVNNAVTFDTLTIDWALVLAQSSTLNGDVIITSSGSLWRVVSTRYLTLTVNGDVLNDGQIGWWGTNLDIHFRWDVQNNGALSLVNRTYLYWDIANGVDSSWTWLTYISDTISDPERTIIPSVNFKPDLVLNWDVELLWPLDFQFSIQLQTNTLFVDGSQDIYLDNVAGTWNVFSSNGNGDGESITFWTVRNFETNIENTEVTQFMFVFTGRNISAQWAVNNAVTFDTLTIDWALVLAQSSTLNGDVIITSSGSLWRVVSTRYLTLTVNGDVLNDGQIGWWGTNLDIHFRWDVQNNGTLSWVNRTYLYWALDNINWSFSPLIMYLQWESISGYDNYILRLTNLDDNTTEEIQVTNSTQYRLLSSDLARQNITWAVKWDGLIIDSDYTEEKCINVPGCFGTWNIPIDIDVPFNLTQQIQDLFGDREIVDTEEQIGKFQSGSGIILGATLPDDLINPSRLQVEVYSTDDFVNPIDTIYSPDYVTSGTVEAQLTTYPGPGDYAWRARVEDEQGNVSDWKNFNNELLLINAFSLFEWFEPYPYGYSFRNLWAVNRIFSWSVNYDENTQTFERIDGNKWDIFESIFGFSLNYVEALRGFETSKLNNPLETPFRYWNCFGMALSAALQYTSPTYISQRYPSFSNRIWDNYIWNNIEPIPNVLFSLWDEYDSVVGRTIFSLQMYQYLLEYDHFENENITTSPASIVNTLRTKSWSTHVLILYGLKGEGTTWHAGVVTKFDDEKIYIWDVNVPYEENSQAHNQYIEINDDDTWIAPGYPTWDKYTELALIDVKQLSNITNLTQKWFSDTDTSITVSWDSDIRIIDSQWRITGYIDGASVEEIPWIRTVKDIAVTLESDNEENLWKQIYMPEKIEGLTIEIVGQADEEYDLMIAGGDYYTKVAGVSTGTGQVDRFTSTIDNLTIDFDDAKIGDYQLVSDNFRETGTGSIFVNSVEVISEPQQYSIDWTEVIAESETAVTYEVDSDVDWVYDTSVSVAPVFTWEQLLEQPEPEPEISDYIYSLKNISYQSGQQKAISSYYSIVPNYDEFNWWEDIVFTTSGEWNPTVQTVSSGRAWAGVLRGGANIRMDVPPAWESYTAYLHIPWYTFEFTTSKDAPPPSDVGTLDFWTKTVNYPGEVVSNWVSFPFLPEDTPFTVIWDGNPVAQTVDWQMSSSWTVRWWTNIRAEIPEPGQTRVIEFTILDQTGTFTIIRQ